MNTFTIINSLIVLLSVIITAAIVHIGNIEENILFFSIVAILLSNYAIFSQERQYHRQEEIRHIEKSLENFYRPLQNLFIGYEQNPMDRYQEQKTKFLEIGCYSHLAEPETRECFKEYQQDNESLGKLIGKVNEDIKILQNKYKEKN